MNELKKNTLFTKDCTQNCTQNMNEMLHSKKIRNLFLLFFITVYTTKNLPEISFEHNATVSRNYN